MRLANRPTGLLDDTHWGAIALLTYSRLLSAGSSKRHCHLPHNISHTFFSS